MRVITVIAFRNGILASDSRLTVKSYIFTDRCKKIWRLKDGSLYAARGDNDSGLILLHALQKNIKPVIPPDADFDAVRIMPDGKIFCFVSGSLWDRWPEKFIAIGSGGRYASAVMRYGGDAISAVRAGIESDVYCGGRVQVLRLKRKR